MSHPYASLKNSKVERDRAAKYASACASGGSVHSDAAQDRKMVKSMVKPSALKVEGAKSSGRLDKFARGGAVKKGSTNVNVIIAPQGGAGGLPVPPVGGPAVPPAAGPPPMMPPGMPPPQRNGGRTRYAAGGKVAKAGGGGAWGVTKYDDGYVTGERHGDKVYVHDVQSMSKPLPAMIQQAQKKSPGLTFVPPGKKTGGRVADGAAWKEGLRNGTQVQHADGKNDGSNIYRGRQVTFATGGPVEANRMGPRMTAGAESGEGRRQKIGIQKRSKAP